MSTILINLAMMMGFFLCMFSMVVGLVKGIPFWTMMFRSAIVLSIGAVVVMAFFRYFNGVLYRFLKDKILEKHEQEDAVTVEEEEAR